jgi:hypothetical protein
MGWVHQDPDGNPQSAWRAQISRDLAFTDVILDTGKVANSNQSWEFYGIPDGVYYYRIQTWDSNDAMGPYNTISAGQSFRIDTVRPTGSPTGANTRYLNASNKTDTFTVNAADNVGLSNVRFAVWGDSGGQNDIVWYDGTNNGNGTWSRTVNFAAHDGGIDQHYNVHVYAYDIAGNTSADAIATYNVYVDTIVPTITSVSTQQYGTRGRTLRAWAYGVTDSLTSIASVTVHLVRPDLSYYAYGSATRNGATNDWYVDINVGPDEVQGQWYADFRAVDQANNVSLVYSAPFTVMSLPQVNIGGTWKSPTDGFVNVGGAWRRIVATFVNIGGTWRKK